MFGKKLIGPWDDGYAVDNYIIKSVYLGEDAFGQKQFNNEYTKIGKLLHDMKYNGHYDTSKEIAELCIPVINEWCERGIDVIIPVPATINRDVQPVYLIAEALSDESGIPFNCEVLIKKDGFIPIKNIPLSKREQRDSVIKIIDAKKECNVLLVDDFYSTGISAKECVNALKNDPNIKKVFFLAIAKTKS